MYSRPVWFQSRRGPSGCSAFDGGHVTSDAGALLLARTDEAVGLLKPRRALTVGGLVAPRRGCRGRATTFQRGAQRQGRERTNQRDRHLQLITKRGRMAWQKASGYNRRALVEADAMRLDCLRALCAIVDHSFSISRAAISLNTTQPSVSKKLQRLEAELGTVLVRRRGGQLYGLTEAGEFVIETARNIVREERKLRQLRNPTASAEWDRIAICASHTNACHVLPPVIGRFRQAFPRVQVDFHQLVPNATYEFVRSGRADLGLASDAPPNRMRGIVSLAAYDMRRSLVAPAGHPLLRLKHPSLADIAPYPLILHNLAIPGANSVMSRFREAQLEVQLSITAFDTAVIKQCVKRHLGVAILPSIALEHEDDGRLGWQDATDLFGVINMFIIVQPGFRVRADLMHLIQCIAPHWTERRIRSIADA